VGRVAKGMKAITRGQDVGDVVVVGLVAVDVMVAWIMRPAMMMRSVGFLVAGGGTWHPTPRGKDNH
jgi:hypothetical protein